MSKSIFFSLEMMLNKQKHNLKTIRGSILLKVQKFHVSSKISQTNL